MVLIADRPAEIADRAVPGHWEGGGSRTIRDCDARGAPDPLCDAPSARPQQDQSACMCGLLAKKIRTLSRHLARSLTWDRGKELAGHAQFSTATGVQVYFCDPSSPWQRGCNENTNGLLRQYFPRGRDLSAHTQRHLDRVAYMLNDRPRQTLGWMKPSEKLAELLR